MCRLGSLLVFISLLCFACVVYGSENVTFAEVPVDNLVNLTNNNELWTILLKDCEKPTLTCVQNNIFKYLRNTLDKTDDLEFTSFLKFSKNKLDYEKIQRSFEPDDQTTDEFWHHDEFPIESMSRSLQDNTAKFFMTHDLEIALPDGIFPNSVLKIAPRGLQDHGTLVNLEIVSKDLEAARGLEGGERTFKKIRKFISEKLIYALLAILLVVKLLAVKFLFLLPLLVGVATAKKLLLKILLFVFPFLHHVFKFCAYYPIQAKFHHHKHLISHIHQVAPHHDHHDGVEVAGPHGYGPPPFEHHGHHDPHYTEYDDDVSVFPDDGTGYPSGFSHRKDPYRDENEIASYGKVQATRRKPGRPLPSTEMERIYGKAEKEAIIKARLEKERFRIREENLRLQDQLNQAIKVQEKLKQHAVYYNKKLPHTKIASSVPYNKPVGIANPPPLQGSPFEHSGSALSDGPGIDLPAGYIPQHTVPQRPPQNPHLQQHAQFEHKYPTVPQNHFEQQYQASIQSNIDQQYQASQVNTQNQVNQIATNQGPVYKPQLQNVQAENSIVINKSPPVSHFDIQKSVEYDPRINGFVTDRDGQAIDTNVVKYTQSEPIENFEKPKPVDRPNTSSKPKLEQAIYQAASITYDKFYSPILQKIDNILQGLGFNDEPCRERLICSMYKNPNKFSPHSNLLSAELSRDSAELQKPTSTNSAVIRFYKYVQAARDGQDQRDCLRLYPACPVNTDVT